MHPNRRSRTDRKTTDRTLMAGFKKHELTLRTIFVDGAHVPVSDIVASLQDDIASADAVEAARASWLTLVVADRERRAKNKVFKAALRQAVRVAFPTAIDALADFGLAPHKERVVSPEDKLVATAKAKATRAARHTMGPRQREKVKGVVPGGAALGVLLGPRSAKDEP